MGIMKPDFQYLGLYPIRLVQAFSLFIDNNSINALITIALSAIPPASYIYLFGLPKDVVRPDDFGLWASIAYGFVCACAYHWLTRHNGKSQD